MFYSSLEFLQDFLTRGGPVLKGIFCLIFLLWFLIVERLWFFYFSFPVQAEGFLKKWQKNPRFQNQPVLLRRWQSELAGFKHTLHKNISYIKTLVALCPLMGLLGTVTGMIAVFEVMALVGTGNARLMADGISMATIPTMAGMVGALSGICVVRLLEKAATTRGHLLVKQSLNTKGVRP